MQRFDAEAGTLDVGNVRLSIGESSSIYVRT
jgi:hypothetical protein